MATERTDRSIDRLIDCIRALTTELGLHYRVKSVGLHEIAVIDRTKHDLEFKIEFEPKFGFSEWPIEAEVKGEKLPDCYLPANVRVFTPPFGDGVGLGIDCDGLSYRFKIPQKEMLDLAKGIVSHAIRTAKFASELDDEIASLIVGGTQHELTEIQIMEAIKLFKAKGRMLTELEIDDIVRAVKG